MKSHLSIAASVLTVMTTLVGATSASASDVDKRLKQLGAQSGPAFVAARDALVADTSARTAIAARAKAATFSDATLVDDIMALIVAERQRDATQFSVLSGLEGLDPDVYLKRRLPAPFVGREIMSRKPSVAALFELALVPSTTAFIDVGRPRTTNDVTNLEHKEARALYDGVLMAIAESGHVAAAPVLKHVSTMGLEADRRAAALALLGNASKTDDTVRHLATFAHDASSPMSVRMGAVVGLGKTRNANAVLALSALIDGPNDAKLRDSAVAALGNAGNRGAFKRSSRTDGDALRTDIGRRLVHVMVTTDDPQTFDVAMSAIALAGTADTLALVELTASSEKFEARRLALEKSARLLRKGLAREARVD